ncbi:hypothetical protein, partial [Alteromonas stellipolaris]|uniref:hypothetical protein n=1 Tax=Alteromonas stellipolaris TaxID=233316 RepID=UPI001D91A78B
AIVATGSDPTTLDVFLLVLLALGLGFLDQKGNAYYITPMYRVESGGISKPLPTTMLGLYIWARLGMSAQATTIFIQRHELSIHCLL